MKIVKINSIACASCIIVNNVIDKIKDNYEIDVQDVDYDFDDYDYEVGKVIPVLIFEDDKGNELSRLVGEVTYKQVETELKKHL